MNKKQLEELFRNTRVILFILLVLIVNLIITTLIVLNQNNDYTIKTSKTLLKEVDKIPKTECFKEEIREQMIIKPYEIINYNPDERYIVCDSKVTLSQVNNKKYTLFNNNNISKACIDYNTVTTCEVR